MAKTSKIAKAPKSFKSYALNKCLIGYGVVNGIINAAIFAGINAGALLSLALPAAGATVTGMMFLKGLVCALGGAVAGWFTISFVVRGQQKADEVAAAMASKTAGAAL